MMSPIHCLHTLVQFNCYDVVLCLRDEIEVFLDRLVTGQVGPPCCVYLCSCLTATDLSVSHKVLNESRPSPGCLHHAAFVSVVFNLFVFSVCYQWGSSLHYFRNILQHCIVNQRFMAIIQVNLRQPRHLQLRTGGFCWCSFSAHMPVLTATIEFRLGRRCWSSQQCDLHCLLTSVPQQCITFFVNTVTTYVTFFSHYTAVIFRVLVDSMSQ